MPKPIDLVLLSTLMLLAGCASEPTKTEEGLLRAAFHAIRTQNGDAFAKLTITRADFLLKENKIGAFETRQSYAGGVLRPEEKTAQADEFRRAVQGGGELIDFRRARFLGAGSVIDQGSLELLSGNTIPVKTYALKVSADGSGSEIRERGPYFVVTPWHGGYRLLGLRFGEE